MRTFLSPIRPVGGYVADWQGRPPHPLLCVAGHRRFGSCSGDGAPICAAMTAGSGHRCDGIRGCAVFNLVAQWFPKDIGLASGIVGTVAGSGISLAHRHGNHERGHRESSHRSLAIRTRGVCAWER